MNRSILPGIDLSVVALLLLEFAVTTLAVVLLCALPFVLVMRIADRFQMRSPIYFGAAALITAAFLTAAITFLVTPTGSLGDPERMEFGQAFTRYLGWTLPGGLAGGLAFWMFGIRYSRD